MRDRTGLAASLWLTLGWGLGAPLEGGGAVLAYAGESAIPWWGTLVGPAILFAASLIYRWRHRRDDPGPELAETVPPVPDRDGPPAGIDRGERGGRRTPLDERFPRRDRVPYPVTAAF